MRLSISSGFLQMMERATEIAPAARRRKSMTAQTAKSDLETIVEVERLSVKRRGKLVQPIG